jgi:hypothetical protein
MTCGHCGNPFDVQNIRGEKFPYNGKFLAITIDLFAKKCIGCEYILLNGKQCEAIDANLKEQYDLSLSSQSIQ